MSKQPSKIDQLRTMRDDLIEMAATFNRDGNMHLAKHAQDIIMSIGELMWWSEFKYKPDNSQNAGQGVVFDKSTES